MGRITRTVQANRDLDDIWLQIALDNPSAADRLIDRIVMRRLGPARPEIAPDARMLVVGDSLVLYRFRKDGVQIVRVVHGARQLEGLFDADPEA